MVHDGSDSSVNEAELSAHAARASKPGERMVLPRRRVDLKIIDHRPHDHDELLPSCHGSVQAADRCGSWLCAEL